MLIQHTDLIKDGSSDHHTGTHDRVNLAQPLRRACGELSAATPVYRGEREIIARN